jgi:hypothetical protein
MVHLHPITRLRLQRDVEHLHALGSRATVEFIVDLTERIGGLPAALALLAEYERRLTPEMIRLAGGDRFPRQPLRVVPPNLDHELAL